MRSHGPVHEHPVALYACVALNTRTWLCSQGSMHAVLVHVCPATVMPSVLYQPGTLCLHINIV